MEVKKPFMIIAGPCAVENKEQMDKTACALKKENIYFLRAGIYKMRTSRYSFQGLREKAKDLIISIKKTYSLKLVSEITDPRHIESLLDIVDVFQVGARNMYNYELLKELAGIKRTVLLKRAFSATVKEWLSSAEYLAKKNNGIILCERGIRTFETDTRNTVDLAGALLAKTLSGLPVIVDPSHGTGRPELVSPVVMAATACGLDGIMVEIHPEPKKALSDGMQALNLNQFHIMMSQLKKLLQFLNTREHKAYESTAYKTAHPAENTKNIQLHSP